MYKREGIVKVIDGSKNINEMLAATLVCTDQESRG